MSAATDPVISWDEVDQIVKSGGRVPWRKLTDRQLEALTVHAYRHGPDRIYRGGKRETMRRDLAKAKGRAA